MPDVISEGATVSQSASASAASVPWQVDWKNPTWTQYSVLGDGSSTSPTAGSHRQKNKSQHHETIVGVSTAQVHCQEIAKACPSLWESLSNDGGVEKGDPDYWLLTVTLLDPSGESCHDRKMENPVASEMILELMLCEAQEIMHSRRLVWPETMGSATQRRKEAMKQRGRWTELGDMFLPWLKLDPVDENTAKQQSTAILSDTGVVAATLCRQPLTKEAKRDEALEVILSIMAGLGSSVIDVSEGISNEERNRLISSPTANAIPTTRSREEEGIDGESDSQTDPLFLACLSSHGLICIYNVWDLLSFVIPLEGEPQLGSITTSSSELNAERAMASWLLGAELFQQLESAWLPLSQPKTTISLSILDETWNLQPKPDQSRQDGIIDQVEDEGQRVVNEPSSANQAFSLALMQPTSDTNVRAWNPWIEASTLPQRTICNRAMSICVVGPSCPFLVIMGQGIPHNSPAISSKARKRKRKSAIRYEENTKTTIEHNSNDGDSKESSKVGPTLASTDAPGTNQDWWKGDLSSACEEESDHVDQEQSNDWWASGDIRVAQSRKSEDEVSADKPSRSNLHAKEYDSNLSLGGFVTFCSMVSWSESKTLFLDFVPRSVTHVEQWHGMELVLCIGDERAVAIRFDMLSSPVLVGMDEELKAILNNDSGITGNHFAQIPILSVKRFQILPIDLRLPTKSNSSSNIESRVLCGAGTTPPALLQMFTEIDLRTKQETGLLVMPNFVGLSENGSILTSTQETGRVAQIPDKQEENQARSLIRSSWAHLGQGWSLFGTGRHVYFVCWEGATTNRGISFLRELPGSPAGIHSPLCVATVVPSQNLLKAESSAPEKHACLPFLETVKESKSTNNIFPGEPDSSDLIVESMQGISSIRFDESASAMGILDTKKDSTTVAPLSDQEKSERLLRHLSSWTQLEETNDDRDWLDRQVPVVAIRCCRDSSTAGGSLNILNMRQIVMENGGASPFSQVLGWLSQKRDFFTAASIALDLQQDPETLYHLWKNAQKIDEEDEENKLQGLLDGIMPVKTNEGVGQSDNQMSTSTPWTQLADMTVGCLIKGGLAMSTTLHLFLQTNRNYDPARASLMLVAAMANTVSGDEAAIVAAMGRSIESFSSANQYSIPELLWPLQSLLAIGVARDYLKTTLHLLNATIPDEMRRRPRQGQGGGMTLPPLDLTTAIVTMIVSCDHGAARLLLDLPSERSSSTFWESLDCESQHTLALINISHKYPMLIQEEVRGWVRKQLHYSLNGGKDPAAAPLEWLRELATACLFNAGCDLTDFLLDPTNMSMMSVGSDNSTAWAEMDDEDGLFQHKLEIVETRNALEPSPGSGGLDFDVLISCLLLLQSHQAAWRERVDKYVSTQALLDAACYLAGRPTGRSEEPRFSLDAKALMEECALSGNVRAGANLIGGKNGFLLSCCDILMLELQVSMEDAEDFFLCENLNSERIMTVETSKFQQKHFELTESHRGLLWLLDEHVLSIRTYGEFESSHYSRGRVDPVFAARSIFRAWLCLTHLCKQVGSDWICRWLSRRLGLCNKETTGHHRLACAAIVRALLWPSSDENEIKSENDVMIPDSLLGHVLQLDKPFLIQLALSSCGLVESLPPSIAEGLIGLVDATQELSTSRTSLRHNRTL